jgi:ABC-type transporter Mla maintaining outer membrane lipid asymmetry ATPase subunit MlaF
MSENIFHAAAIEMRGVTAVSLRDADFTVVEAAEWTVMTGEFWLVAGQQHSGKSDFLMHAAGLVTPAEGTCRVFGCETEDFGEAQIADRLRVGYVFAGGKLFTQLSIAENVALPLRYQSNLSAEAAARTVAVLLEMLELTPFADFTPSNLSTNWRQRAALARALVLKPELLLLDNPLGGLGARHCQWLLQFLDQLWRGHEWLGGRPMTLVVTTDDLKPWQDAGRKFAMLHDKKFTVIGSWRDVEAMPDHAVKELLAEPAETTN